MRRMTFVSTQEFDSYEDARAWGDRMNSELLVMEHLDIRLRPRGLTKVFSRFKPYVATVRGVTEVEFN